jgi:hypothetical protein
VDIKDCDLAKAYDGSYYTISGTGDPLEGWVEGYEKELEAAGCGKPVAWFKTTGGAINDFCGAANGNPYPDDLPCLLFPLDDMNVGVLAIFKLQWQDRWFDDVIDNMRRQGGADD